MYKILLMFAASALAAFSVGVGTLDDDCTIVSNDAFTIQTKLYSTPSVANKIKTEPITFFYVYLDGDMVIRVDSCK